MRAFTTTATLFLLIFCSCQKKEDSGLDGTYTERSPVAGRSLLIFLDGSKVVKKEPGSTFCDTFHYRLGNRKIILTPAWTHQYLPEEFGFEIIDNNSFKVEDIYPSIGFGTHPMMVYEK